MNLKPLIHLALHRGWITVGTPTYKTDRRAYNRQWMRRYRATHPRPKLRARKTNVRRGDYPRTEDGQRAYQRDIMRAVRAAGKVAAV